MRNKALIVCLALSLFAAAAAPAAAQQSAPLGPNSPSKAVANKYTATPGNPTGTASTSGVMMGLAGSITPNFTGVVLFQICGDLSNNTNGDGAQVYVRYGTAGAPSNGASVTGAAAGTGVAMYGPSSSARYPFCAFGIASLTLSTAYWFDAELVALTGGTANAYDLTVTAVELK